MTSHGAAEKRRSVGTEHIGNLWIITAVGDLDAVSAPDLREEAKSLSDDGAVILDLTPVEFIDSVGLGAVIGALRRVHEEGGALIIAASNGPVRRALELVGVARLVPVVASIRDACEALDMLGSPVSGDVFPGCL